MEPNKLESQFREKLSHREINPSGAAWDRLEAMLTVAEKPKRNYTFWYVAASIVGFLFVGTVFFNQKENPISIDKNEVVIENGISKTLLESTTKSNVRNDIANIVLEKDRLALDNKRNRIVTEKNKTSENSINQNQEKISSIINQKTEQKSIQPILSEPSIDVLLAAVERSSKASDSNEKRISVNASKLLLQVDGELDLSFREKVIGSVNRNYQTVKVALANRNQE